MVESDDFNLIIRNYLIDRQNQPNNMESESHQRWPLNLTRGRVIQHPSRRNQRSSSVILQTSNNETNSGFNEVQVSTIQIRDENNQRFSRNYRLDLTDYTSPPSYAEATSAIPETLSSEE